MALPTERGIRRILVLAATIPTFLEAASASEGRERVRRELEESASKPRTVDDWTRRREELRRAFLEGAGLWPFPERTPPRVLAHSRRRRHGYSVENVAVETFPGFWCTGNLYRPAEALRGPHAAVLSPHGHFEPLGRMRSDQQIRCAHLARMGAVVFSYSMVGWQDSQQTSHADPLVLALQTANSLRVLDFLCGLAEVDPERIGATGASGGGTQSIYAALLDDRVKACAPVAIVYPWACPEGCVCEGGMPVMQAARTNIIELCAAIAPRALLVQSVGGDATRDFPELGLPFLDRTYSIHGRRDRLRHAHFDAEGHDYGPSKRRATYQFFSELLGLEFAEEDASTIAVEPPEQMTVFDAAHPLPEDAARGCFEVSRAFGAWTGRGGAVALDDDGRLVGVPEEGEEFFFTPAGFKGEGRVATDVDGDKGQVRVVVRDKAHGRATPCRINVVGADGRYYHPAANPLAEFSLTGQWPEEGAKGNRPEKAPYRYSGRFFYATGEATVDAPVGDVRVEVWKGFEYRPVVQTVRVHAGETAHVDVEIERTLDAAALGYHGGDPHLHFARTTPEDEQTILDLLEAEDVRYGVLLAYNEPAGPYSGDMAKMAAPQMRGLGERSILERNGYRLMSGQEYRTGAFGHLNLHQRENLVFPGESFNADDGPAYGEVAAATRKLGGRSVYAHGGYAQEIYADVARGLIDAVELLQFGVYRGIGLEDWYHILNAGYRLPITGASDYPACRWLGDCRTYVEGGASGGPPSFPEWLKALSEGRSFATTGPVLLLEVDGQRPGGAVRRTGKGPHRLAARVRARCEVADVTDLELIVNGRVAARRSFPRTRGVGEWLELSVALDLEESAWIAARALSTTPGGRPDAEAHTNPVWAVVDGKMPYRRESLDRWVRRIDDEIARHSKREFRRKAEILAYFQGSRDVLLRVREMRGLREDTRIEDLVNAAGPAGTEDRDLSPDGGRAPTDEELAEFLKSPPPKSPEEQLATFEAAPGFEMQLVASEPMLVDPIAAAFDEDGRLYVCEMRDYPYKPAEGRAPLGTVRLLRDLDGDGRMDAATVFADGLLWAGGVAPWRGGVFVASPPDVWYLRDVDGDGKADLRLQVFTGFGTQNQQAMLNNLTWQLDGKIYGSTAGNGGVVRPGDGWSEYLRLVEGRDGAAPGFESVPVNGRDFRFDPRTGRFETLTGTQQFGTTFDDWGNRFLCNESNPLQHVVLHEHYLKRNPYLAAASAIENTAPSPVPIHRISPVERWRRIRSSRRVQNAERSAASPGASHHVVDAAAGVTVYRGGAYGLDWQGTAFVCDGQNNLIHCRRLIPNGATFRSERVHDGIEFVRSSDVWFRPVNLVHAPDGTLYCLDMSREVLETIHIPLDVAKHLDLTSGRDRGRIYRIAPTGFQSRPPPPLSRRSSAELASLLESPHAYLRDSAARLLCERQDSSAQAQLEAVAVAASSPQARLAALWTLEGLSLLSDETLSRVFDDEAAGVRENALKLAEPRLSSSLELTSRAIAAARDPDPRVRFQAAFSLGESSDPRVVDALLHLATSPSADSWTRIAVLTSAGAFADEILSRLLVEPSVRETAEGRDVLDQLSVLVGARNASNGAARVLADASRRRGEIGDDAVDRLLRGLGEGMRRAGERLRAPEDAGEAVRALVDGLSERSRTVAVDERASEAARVDAIASLALFPFAQARDALEACLDPKAPVEVQKAAVRALADDSGAEAAPTLLQRWAQFSPPVRAEALSAMLAREELAATLLEAALAGRASLVDLPPSRRELLRSHRNPRIAELAGRLFGDAVKSDRSRVLADYREALARAGDAEAGRAVYEKHCIGCHRIGSKGADVGPNLAASAARGRAAILEDVLDPNRYVAPNYAQYTVVDAEGRSFAGVIASQTATSLTLKRDNGESRTVLASDVEELTNTGRSLMPEGFEAAISKGEMADLLAYVESLADWNEADARRRDFGTEPGLTAPER